MTDETIFATALEKADPAERAAFLAEACGDDPARRQRLEGLLLAHARAANFLERPPDAAHDSDHAATQALTGTPDPGVAAAQATVGENSASDDEPLTFLGPPTRPDSLGRIGHYEVLQILGRGGFGIVFRAFDEMLQRVVALKVMAPQLAATSPARKRFLREARLSAQVRHENVVQVYEVAEQPLPYLAMEFIPGETLQQKLNRVGPLDVPEVLRIGRQIAEGLAAAHATDLIHRDIKPGNVLLEGGHQKVKITDFGLARAADDASISQSGIIAGTPMYMAPEQAQGQTLDQRADLFSLGSVLYQMVAGRPPFRANTTVAVMKRVAEDKPRAIREIIPEAPQWLCDIIAKLHAKNPDDRYQSAREVADVLADCEAQFKANARLKDYSRIPRSKPQRSGRRKWVAAAAVLFLSVIALPVMEFAGLTHLFRGQAPPAPGNAGNGPTTLLAVAKKASVDPEPPTIDLIPLARPDPRFGTWKRAGNTLVSIPDPNTFSSLPLPVEPPREFILEAVFERLAGTDFIGFVIPAFGTDFDIFLDGYGGVVSGLQNIAGKSSLENGIGVRGTQLVNGQRHTVRVTVRKSGVTTTLDGRILFEYRGGYDKLASVQAVCGQSRFYVVINSAYRIHSLRLIPQDDSPPLAFAPFTDADVQRIAALPAAEQVEEVRKELMRRNPGFDGKIEHKIEGGVVTEFKIVTDKVTDIAPIRVFDALRVLVCSGTWTGKPNAQLADLTPLKGMNLAGLRCLDLTRTKVTDAGMVYFKDCKNLTVLNLSDSQVSDAGLATFKDCKNLTALGLDRVQVGVAGLAAFKDCKNLTALGLGGTKVSDAGLAIFKDCKDLKQLYLGDTQVSDASLAHFKGMSLRVLWIDSTGITDLTPLQGMPLEEIRLTPKNITKGLDILRDMTSLKTIGIEWKQVWPAAEFWQRYDKGEFKMAVAPFTDADIQRIAALPAAEQVEAVRRELKRRNPGFDGKMETKIEGGVVTEIKIVTDKVTDIAPIRVFDALRVLECYGSWTFEGPRERPMLALTPSGLLADLTPLGGMNLASLTHLNLTATKADDAGMVYFKDCKNLRYLDLFLTQVSDAGLVHFKDCNALTELNLVGTKVSDAGLAHFKDCKNLTFLWLNNTQVGDAGLAHFKDCKALTNLNLAGTKVSDVGLAHFKDCKNLKYLWLDRTQIGDAGLANFKGILLRKLSIDSSGITDLTPLQGMPLEEIRLTPKNITKGLDILRDMKSLKTIGIAWQQSWPAAEFWQRYDKGEFK